MLIKQKKKKKKSIIIRYIEIIRSRDSGSKIIRIVRLYDHVIILKSYDYMI
jgi:hypothetical protein